MNLNKLKYLFYLNIDNKVVYFHTRLDKYFLSEEQLFSNYGLIVKKIDKESDKDLTNWCNVINNSYEDCFYNIDKAKKQLTGHLFLENTTTYLFYFIEDFHKKQFKCFNTIINEEKSNLCATISTGNFKNNSDICGCFRLACHNNYKGKGFGKAIVLYALSQLQKSGFDLCEDLVSSKRIISIMMHMELGFEPQFSYNHVIYKQNLRNINFMQKLKLKTLLKNMHKKYLNKLNEKFI